MIVHRTAVNLIRTAEARSAREDRHARDHHALHSSDGDDPSHDLHASDEARIVRAALAGLAPQQRQALELAYYDGHTYREVAELLGIPIGTAKTWIRAGLLGLQESMAIQAVQATQIGHDDSETNPSAARHLVPDQRRQSRKR